MLRCVRRIANLSGWNDVIALRKKRIQALREKENKHECFVFFTGQKIIDAVVRAYR